MQNDEILFEKDGSNARWIMPTRDLKEFRNFGWMAVGIGTVISLFMIGWISGPLLMGIGLLRKGEMFGWLFVGFGALGFTGLLFAARILILGTKILNNKTRCELTIKGNKLINTEKLGLLNWKRKIRLDSINELVIEDGKQLKSGRQLKGPAPDGIHALIAKCSDKKFFALVGYPEDITLKVANQLSAEIGKSLAIRESSAHSLVSHATSGKQSSKNIPVSIGSDSNYQPSKPTDCEVVVLEKRDGTVAYEVPAQGVVKASKGLLGFSIIWLVFCCFIFGSMFFVPAEDGKGFPWFALLFAIPFVGVGIGLLIVAINAGKKSVMLGVMPDGLLFIEKKSMFGTKWLEFNLDEIRKVQIGSSGVEVNEVPIQELKIIKNDGSEEGLLSQLKEDELEWLAYSLNTTMGIDPSIPHEVSWKNEVRNLDLNNLQFPEDSRIELEKTSQGMRINVPSLYVRYFLALTIFGLLFAAVGFGIIAWNFKDGASSWLFALLFPLFGIIAIAVSLFVGTRKFEFRVEPERLEIDRTSLFGTSSFSWRRDEIESIELADSGFTVNQKSMIQLHIQGLPKGLKLMSHWSTNEIAITAALLNQMLELESPDPNNDQPA